MDTNADLIADTAPTAQPESKQLTEFVANTSVGQPVSSENETRFSKAVDDAKLRVLQEAALKDKKFIEDFEKQLKEATIKLAQVEQEKADTEKARAELQLKTVQYEQELTDTKRKLNEYQQTQNQWENKQKARQFHYNGVKNIMLCLGITEPMCIPLLYLIFPIALVFFLIKSIVTATFGNLLCGAVDSNRPKAMKGFLWTILAVLCVLIVALLGYLGYKHIIVGGLL